MSEKLQRLTKADMTEAQRACFDLLCAVFHGEHHAPERIYAFGRGIKCNAESHRLSTFDFDYLTRLVVLAHDACVRVEIVSSGPGRIGLVLHKRAGRTGSSYDRHPTMEEAIERVRPKRLAQAA